jgi:DNA-binding cell septation regulator SpoVG
VREWVKDKENDMETTFYPSKVDGKVLAFADVEVARGIMVRGFRVVNGKKGLFASAPQKPYVVGGETRWSSQVLFLDPDVKERFLAEILDAYQRWLKSRGGVLLDEGGHGSFVDRGGENPGTPF